MKKKQKVLITITSLIILTFFASTVQAQVCEGNYIIDGTDTSGDIAALSSCTEITGNLSIDSTSLTSLSGLESLTSLGGDLYIAYNDTLTSLSGLENLTSVGDYFSIAHNDALTSLSGLESLTSVGSSLYIFAHAALTNLCGLENLTSVGGNLWIYETALTSLGGLENLTSVGGTLNVRFNTALTSLTGMESLTSVVEWLVIYHNTALTSLTGLENLTSVGEELEIEGNDALTSLNGLENLTSVGGTLLIAYNASLPSLCALYNVNLSGYKLKIYYNTALSMDTAYALEMQLRSNGFTGTADIYDNYGTGIFYCDEDIDEDGVLNNTDNCPTVSNPIQEDADNDGIGDACDSCPNDADNDADDDGECGDVDICPNDANNDVDGDELCGGVDNCPSVGNVGQEDVDSDGIGDVCDNCPSVGNVGQEDADNDGIGDPCDSCTNDSLNDADGDGVCGDVDNCPTVSNPGQEDDDNDGRGDDCHYNITWWTDDSSCESCWWDYPEPICQPCDTNDPVGSTATTEISRTQIAALEAFLNIMPKDPQNFSSDCYYYDYYNNGCAGFPRYCSDYRHTYRVCMDGTWSYSKSYSDWLGDSSYESSSGSWNVCEDSDSDGICGDVDNCPLIANPGQADCDNNNIGDVCDNSSICSGLMAYYPFSGNAHDTSGSANHAAVNGAALTEDLNGNPGNSYSFDGDDDYISSSLDAPKDWVADKYTVSLWVKATYTDQEEWTSVFNNYDMSGYSPNSFQIDFDGNSNYRFLLKAADNSVYKISFGPATDDQWQHLAVTYDGTNLTTYVDGNFSLQTDEGNYDTHFRNYIIGRNRGGDKYFNGSIDEVRVYDRALNETEVLELYGYQAADSDNDGHYDFEDNCPDTCNSQQSDADSDGIGDVCDSDPKCGHTGACGQPECETEC